MKASTDPALNESSRGALAGVRVLDFSRMLPGPWASQLLADLGADVIKVEQPGVGDLGRHNSPNFRDTSVYFNSVNLNKHSVTLDLGSEAGRADARRLAEGADVVIESFRGGVADRLGIGYEQLAHHNPAIIYCAITGFGQQGPLSGIPGHDLVVQATTGVMAAGEPGPGAPPMPAFQAADYTAGAYAVVAILAALRQREAGGRGAYLDIAMHDCLFSMTNLVNGLALARAAGNQETGMMQLWGGNPRYATYVCRDGKAVAVSLLEARIWHHFCRIIERPDLIDESETPRERHSAHGERAALYRGAIQTLCDSHDRDQLVARMVAQDVPILPVNSPAEAIASEQAAARGMLQWVEHPVEGRIPVLGNPLSRSGLTRGRRRPAPLLGADNAALAADDPWNRLT